MTQQTKRRIEIAFYCVLSGAIGFSMGWYSMAVYATEHIAKMLEISK